MNWYCIHTKPQKEQLVAQHLRGPIGLDTYLPLLKSYRTIRRVRRLVTSPLFPRYLFCRLDAGISYRAVRYSPDVLNIVSVGQVPAVVPDGLISELRCWAGDALDERSVRPTLRAGTPVEITHGPLRGLSAVILHASDSNDRVAILLTLLQRDARLTIDRHQLTPVA